MHPELIALFGEPVPAYFVLLAFGFMVATAVQATLGKRVGIDPDAMINLGISMLLWGLVGARLLHVLADGYFWDYVHQCTDPGQVAWRITHAECTNVSGRWDGTLCHPQSRDCFAWAKFWAGGLAYYGGFVAASLGAVFTLRREKLPFLKVADLAAVSIPLGLTFGRIGCFLSGCCFGKPTSAAWSVSFPPWSDASRAAWKAGLASTPALPSAQLHPTQLYEAAASLVIAAIVAFRVWPRRKHDGDAFVAFVALYALARFALEFFRADDRGGFAMFSTSQWISLAMVVGAITVKLKFVPPRGVV